MKIHDILTEDANTKIFEEIINSDFFKVNLLPYIDKDLEKIPLLYHGGKFQGKARIANVKPRHKPSDSKPIFHNAINTVSNKVFGVPIRNLFFATRRHNTAENYGDLMMVIPLHNYKLFYSKEYTDMFAELEMSDTLIRRDRKRYISKAINTYQVQEKIDNIIELMNEETNNHTSEELTKQIINDIGGSITHDELGVIGAQAHDKVEEFKDSYDQNTVAVIRKVLINSLSALYSVKDVADSSHYEKIVNILWEISIIILDIIIKSDLKFIKDVAVEYIDTIEETKVLSDIPKLHEVMCSTGRYAIMKIERFDNPPFDPLKRIFEYYRSVQSASQ